MNNRRNSKGNIILRILLLPVYFICSFLSSAITMLGVIVIAFGWIGFGSGILFFILILGGQFPIGEYSPIPIYGSVLLVTVLGFVLAKAPKLIIQGFVYLKVRTHDYIFNSAPTNNHSLNDDQYTVIMEVSEIGSKEAIVSQSQEALGLIQDFETDS